MSTRRSNRCLKRVFQASEVLCVFWKARFCGGTILICKIWFSSASLGKVLAGLNRVPGVLSNECIQASSRSTSVGHARRNSKVNALCHPDGEIYYASQLIAVYMKNLERIDECLLNLSPMMTFLGTSQVKASLQRLPENNHDLHDQMSTSSRFHIFRIPPLNNCDLTSSPDLGFCNTQIWNAEQRGRIPLAPFTEFEEYCTSTQIYIPFERFK